LPPPSSAFCNSSFSPQRYHPPIFLDREPQSSLAHFSTIVATYNHFTHFFYSFLKILLKSTHFYSHFCYSSFPFRSWLFFLFVQSIMNVSCG
jgi:hypothetical protein